MSDQTPATAELPPPPTAPPTAPPAAAEPRTRLRDRSLRLPLLSLIAVACLLVGGGVGAVIGYAVHADAPDGPGRIGFERPDGPGGQGGVAPPDNQQAPGSSS